MQLSGSDNKVNIYKDTTINGNLDVGLGAANTKIKAHVNHAGSTGYMGIEGRWRDQGYINPATNYGTAYLFLSVKNDPYMYCGNNIVNVYKNTTKM